jgi:small subunit ribosomal protein S6
MALYEHVFLARQDISGQQADALAEHFKGILEGNGGKVGKVENWGLRSTTYRIKKNRKAHYVLVNIDAPAKAVAEMERQMRIHEDILRYITIRVEKHEDGPSAILKKVDREDRGDRFDRGDRGPRRDRGDRPPRDFGDRGPRGDSAPRGDAGDGADKPRRSRPRAAEETQGAE